MASYSVTKSKSATFTSTTADAITFTQLWPAVDISNDDDTNDMWFRDDGTTAAASADNATRIPAGQSKVCQLRLPPPGTNQIISVVGNGGAYTVEGVN